MSEIIEGQEGVIAAKLMDDGRELTIAPMLFGKYRLHVSEVGSDFVDDGW